LFIFTFLFVPNYPVVLAYFQLLSAGFSVVNVPLQAKRADVVSDFSIRRFVELCQETME
jgi:hypothetical protein